MAEANRGRRWDREDRLLHPLHEGAVHRVHADLLGIAFGDTQGLSGNGPGIYFTRSMKVRSTVFTRIFSPASM